MLRPIDNPVREITTVAMLLFSPKSGPDAHDLCCAKNLMGLPKIHLSNHVWPSSGYVRPTRNLSIVAFISCENPFVLISDDNLAVSSSRHFELPPSNPMCMLAH
ncbi:hypothetical protein C8034_v007242 [Colletotrichum sidae]|uniref:Uncharacterized protein n=2 Tax=Colletotrichum orbiculare species complex TaxID=2707354 RepID=A0A4R8RK72_COLTR|nr:hypothetical protein CTRI78_v003121 [Colletotrichum trifolii]TEA11532.1 hypothetical protein C8034_v007242 [Colletotrichum sidae]